MIPLSNLDFTHNSRIYLNINQIEPIRNQRFITIHVDFIFGKQVRYSSRYISVTVKEIKISSLVYTIHRWQQAGEQAFHRLLF